MPLNRTTALLLLCILLVLPLACGNDEGPVQPGGNGGPVIDDALPVPELVCPEYTSAAYPEMAPLVVEKSASLGFMDGAFAVSSTGLSSYTIALTLPPGRRLAPALSLVVDGFAGVAISGLSSIQRCGANLTQDNELHGVRLDSSDELCLNGKRLIAIGTGNDDVGAYREYRTFPDTQTRIRGYGAPTAIGFDVASFVTYSPNGVITHYGATANSRVLWRGVPRTWNKEREMDRRGNTIRYAYAALKNGDKNASTAEMVIDTMTYTGFVDDNGIESYGDAVVDFQYDDDTRHGKLFYEGEDVSRRMRLARVDMLAAGVNVRSYRLTYDEDALTNRVMLARVDECAQGDVTQCKPATSFQWTKATQVGFTSQSTPVHVPTKSEDDQFSWTVADVTGDGAVDIVTSTKDPDTGLNRWFVYQNAGTGDVGAPMEWFAAAFPQGFGKPWQITPVDENGDGRIDLLIDQPDGTAWNTMRVLRSVATPAPHFELTTTSIPRTSQHRASEFTVDSHFGMAVADIDADGMNDVITCRDLRTHDGVGEYVPDDCDADAECKPSLARWSAHLWRPNGFESTERHIEALDGVSCWTMSRFFGAVDWDADGQTDLVTLDKTAHWQTHTFNVTTKQWESQTLSAILTNVLSVNLPGVPLPNLIVMPLTKTRAELVEAQGKIVRTLFPDVNGDGIPDILHVGARGTSMIPFVLVNKGHDEFAMVTDAYDAINGNSQTFAYSPFARVFDLTGDGRDDLVLPVGGACANAEDGTCYVVFESGRLGEPAKVTLTSIPFENSYAGSVAPQYLLRTADMNADGLVDILHPTVNAHITRYENLGAANRLQSVTTGRNPLDPGDAGFQPDVAIQYTNLVDGSDAYTARFDAGNGCEYPRACVVGGATVVASYMQNNGQNQPRHFEVYYKDGRAHRHGRGFLGFGEVETRDVDTGSITTQHFDNVTFDSTFRTYPFAGMPAQSSTTVPVDGTVLETSTSATYEVRATNNGATYFLAPLYSEKRHSENGDQLELSWTSTTKVDDFGIALETYQGTDGIDGVDHVVRVVKNDVNAWLLGMVEKESACSTAGAETLCNESRTSWNARGEVFRTERAPNETNAHFVSYVLRNKYGNPTNVIADDDFGNHREACITYESKGIFPWAMRNPAGHTSFRVYQRGLGALVATRDPNGLVAKTKIDTFGRTVEEHAPDGLITSTTRTRSKNAVWSTRVMESTPGFGATETIFDAGGRITQQRIRGPDIDTAGISTFGKSVWIVRDNQYDAFGRLAWQSMPRIDGDVIAESQGTSYEYDNAGRVLQSVSPWALVKYAYDHDKVTQTEPGPQGIATITTTTLSDERGRVERVTDAKQGVTKYDYGPFGQLRRVVLPDGATRETLSDAYGRATFENDPDRGKTLLEHNGFDEVIHLHDALGRHYAFERDALGRTTKRAQALDVSTYEYDTAAHGIGLPARMTGTDGHHNEYEYDALSRLTKQRLRLADGRVFEHGRTYDPFGRLLRLTYPSGISVLHDYDSTGTLVQLRNGSTRAALWTRDMVDVTGQTMLERFGNGATTERVYQDGSNVLETIFTMAAGKTLQSLRYDYDAQFNVKSRFDALQGKRELARHDALNRVTCTYIDTCAPGGACVDVPASCDVAVKYGLNGDIVSKSDVGLYVPDANHPHAVHSAGMKLFAYDAVGNQIERPGQTITYTDFDLPRQYIPRDGGAATVFAYSANGKRIQQTRGEHETIYLDDVYELETNANVSSERFYVANDERVVAIMERSSAGDAWQFVHVDHVGSVDVVTDSAGNEIERRSYDVWGAPRDPHWGGNGLPAASVLTRRGFTGHEHDNDDLVNAKGRIYDPTIAQFLQTDPVIGDALDAQTYHPYSYVYNRPLVFTDPSGFNGEAISVLLQGSGTPEYVAPDRAQLVQDTQKTVIWQWPRETAANTATVAVNAANAGAPPPSIAAANPAEPDMPTIPPQWIEFGAGLGVGTLVGITPFGSMVDPVRNNPQLGNHTDDYLFGKAGGEFAGGIALMHAGIATGHGGVAVAATGEGLFEGLAIVGVGGVMVMGGGANAVNALQDLWILMMAGGGGTTSPPVHGNSADSEKAQHGYEIRDTKKDEIVKTGVSGGPLKADGRSTRADGQARAWDRETNEPGRFEAKVVKEVPAGPGARRDILKWERENADRLRQQGQLRDTDRHVKP